MKSSTCLAKFADYGFNKSHAAAYALIAYQTAWFKTHYPVEFLAASMTFDKSNTDKLAEFRDEARRLGIVVEPPSIIALGRRFRRGARQRMESSRSAMRFRRSRASAKGRRSRIVAFARRAAFREPRRFRETAEPARGQ